MDQFKSIRSAGVSGYTTSLKKEEDMHHRSIFKVLTLLLALSAPMILTLGCGDKPDEHEAVLGGWIVAKLTEESGLYPSWAPDGSIIVYCARSYTSVMDLHSVPVEGGPPTQLTNISGLELYPGWNSNASLKELIFVNTSFLYEGQSTGHSKIYTGSFTTRDLNIELESDSILAYPSFSHDRSHIVYLNESATHGIWYVEAGETPSNPQLIPNSAGWGDVFFARASHSDDRVVYIETKNNSYNIWTISLSGGEPVQVTANPTGSTIFIHSADISYDGTMIVYDASNSPTSIESRLYVVPAGGGESIPVTATEDGIFHNPSWSPDDRKIAVNRKTGATGSGDVYIVELDL
jgi:Tol biopolymer transport system component